MFLLLFAYSLLTLSCADDTDLLRDAVLKEDGKDVDTLNGSSTDSDDGLVEKTAVFHAVSDAFLEGDQGYNNMMVRVEEDNRTSFLKFDLSTIPGSIERATLIFTIYGDEGHGIVEVFKGTAADWSEQSLSAANAPGTEIGLASMNKAFKLGATEKIELSAKALYPEETTLILTHRQGNDFAFASKENPKNIGPKLEVTYFAPPGSAEPQTGNASSQDETNPSGGTSDTTGNNSGDTDTASGETDSADSSGSTDGSGGSNSTDSSGSTDSSQSDSAGSGSDSSSGSSSDSSTDTGSSDTSQSGSDTSQSGSDSGSQTSTGGTTPPGLAYYYVTPNGSASNNGLSEASAWSITHAFRTAVAGDVVFIKAGDYGNLELRVDNSGTASNPIRFIGYRSAPGDINSSGGSTFQYGEQVDASKMPLIRSTHDKGQTGIRVQENYIELENFQITGFNLGLLSTGTHVALKNIVATELGNQNSFNSYDGIGLDIRGNYSRIENCFVLNATAESIKLYDSDYSYVNNCSVYADNPGNPTDYYFLLTGGTNNTIVENSYAERAQGLEHGGHGFDLKDLAEYNVFRNCTAKRTQIELNFSGVKFNTIENCTILGVDTSASEWHARILIANGANNNLIKGARIENTWTAISLHDYDDGYVGPGGDRDLKDLGFDNRFENLTIINTNRMLNIGGGSEFTAKARNYLFQNCSVTNFNSIAVVHYLTENFTFEDCTFDTGQRSVIEVQGQYAPYSNFDVIWKNCTWLNVDFETP